MEDQDTEDNFSEDDLEIIDTSSEDQETPEQANSSDKQIIEDLNNKYLRLYAEFENYKKRVNKDKEELVKYGNESLLYELLPAIDNLELALKHAQGDANSGLVQGVEMTLKELQRTLEKFGLAKIEADGKTFDPSVHHAMMKIEREDIDEMLVVEELRTGYIYRKKVLRPSLVSVSIKPKKAQENTNKEQEEAEDGSEIIGININENTEEES